MQRKIITTIKIAKRYIQITCIEKIAADLVELFNNTKWTNNNLEQTSFIKKSINSINEIIGGEIKSVIAIVETNKQTNLEIKMIEKTISIASSHVDKNDIKNVVELAKKQFVSNEKEIILAQPIRFTVRDIIEKSYNQAPLNKKGDQITVRLAVSSISKKVKEYISQTIENAGLKVSQILTETHAVAQSTISNSALSSGAISMTVGMQRTLLSVNANTATVSSTELNFGYKHLINKVAETFSCTQEEAENLIKVHGKLTNGSDDTIFTSQDGIKNISFTERDLNSIIAQFILKIVNNSKEYISKYKPLTKLGITLSGEIQNLIGLKEFLTNQFETQYINIYKPLQFVASNQKNTETIGVIEFTERYDKVLGKDFNTIVMTNPNSISTIFENKKINVFTKFFNIIGGKHVTQ